MEILGINRGRKTVQYRLPLLAYKTILSPQNKPNLPPKSDTLSGKYLSNDFKDLHGNSLVSAPVNVIRSLLEHYNVPLPQYTSTSLRLNPVHLNKAYICKSTHPLNLARYILHSLVDTSDTHYSKYLNAMDCLLANLIRGVGLNKACSVIYKRDLSCPVDPIDNPLNIRPNVLNKCVDYLHERGLVVAQKGVAYESSGIASSVSATSQFLYLMEALKIEVALCKNDPMIKLKGFKSTNKFKTENGVKTVKQKAKFIPLPRSRRKLKQIEGLNTPVREYNKNWLSHAATVGERRLIPFCYRVFNNESLELGGRFYGADHLGMSKGDRARILIDGEKTVEPDFSAMHIGLLYSMVGEQFNYVKNHPKYDPYIVDGFSRDTVKIAMLSLVNAENLGAWKRNITRSGKVSAQEAYRTWKDGEQWRIDHGQENKEKPKELKGFIDGIPIGTKGGDLLKAILKRHSLISHLFGSKDLGLKLQFLDSEIMAKTLITLSKADIPALPVHDSLRVKERDEQAAIEAMMQAYIDLIGFEPHIESDQSDSSLSTEKCELKTKQITLKKAPILFADKLKRLNRCDYSP